MAELSTPSGTPIKGIEKRGGSFVLTGDAKRTRTSVNDTVTVESKPGHVARLRWTEFFAAVGDQGSRRDDVDVLKDVFFPRPLKLREANGGSISLDDHPIWHRELVARVIDHPIWQGLRERFDDATEESDLYAPICDILNLISAMTRDTPQTHAASQTTRLTWVSTPETPLILPPESETPATKPDLVGLFGNSVSEPGKLMGWTSSPDTWAGRIEAVDVLIPIEVGFVKIIRPEDSDKRTINPPDPNVATIPSSAVGLQAADITDGGAEARYSAGSRRVQAGEVPDPKQKPIPSLFRQFLPSYFGEPLHKARIMVGVLATIREVQPFRTGALGFVFMNTELTLVYSTLAGTLMTYPMDIFRDARTFITTIIHLTVADYPQHGFDPFWVSDTRTHHPDPNVRAVADPRNASGRILTVQGSAYAADASVLRRFTIHGRGTTVVTVRPIGQAPLLRAVKVIKGSWVVKGRALESTFYREAIQNGYGLHIMGVEGGFEAEMAFWKHTALEGFPPLEVRELRIVTMDRAGQMLGTIFDNQTFLRCFMDAMAGELHFENHSSRLTSCIIV